MKAFFTGEVRRCPDGRALYAYRCTSEEFASLAELLSRTPTKTTGATSTSARGFVLYASEWWQREYDGRHWAWEPLLESIGWNSVEYPDLYEPVRTAWRWWKIELVRLPTSIRYLGTFACQGGLPLGLVGNADSNVARYLRAVLKHTAAYRRFVEDPIDLAQDLQHLLRPPTLRRDYVFRLAADLIEAVLRLRDHVNDEDPLTALEQAELDWRRTMPLDLEDDRARGLLTGLLLEAVRVRTSPRRGLPSRTVPSRDWHRMADWCSGTTSTFDSVGSPREAYWSYTRRPSTASAGTGRNGTNARRRGSMPRGQMNSSGFQTLGGQRTSGMLKR